MRANLRRAPSPARRRRAGNASTTAADDGASAGPVAEDVSFAGQVDVVAGDAAADHDPGVAVDPDEGI